MKLKEPQAQLDKEIADKNLTFLNYHDKYFYFDNFDSQDGNFNVSAKVPTFNHQYAFMYVVIQGTLHIKVNSIPYSVKAGESICIMPCTKIEIEDSVCKYYAVAIRSYLLFDIFSTLKAKSQPFYSDATQIRLSDVGMATFLSAQQSYKQALKFNTFKLDEYVVRGCISIMFFLYFSYVRTCEIKNQYKETAGIAYQTYIALLKALKTYSKKNRTVQFYADVLNVGPKTLSVYITEIIGVSASVLIDYNIVITAESMIYNSEQPINVISDNLSFKSQSFFGRYFKRISGMSPREFITKYGKNLALNK